MLKVFLVEDEFVIREGIKNNIDWKAHGYEFCGEAGDGELAYPMIQKLRPDIVITDIRMPFMDGLELSRLIRKELPDTEIIILSGYQEFEYAKEAIKLGVAQYLSKPINGEELLAELDELSAKIEEKHRAIQIRERYLQEMEENNLRERKNCSRNWSPEKAPWQNCWNRQRFWGSICRHPGTILFCSRPSLCVMRRMSIPAA